MDNRELKSWPDAEMRLLSVLNTVVDGIITIDGKGLIEAFNFSAERIFGYLAAEVVGKNVNILMPDPFHEEHDGYLAEYHKTGKAKIIGIGREVIGRRKDGSVFPMDLAVSQFRLADQVYFTGIVRDISDRKAAEEALRESKRDLEQALNELRAATQQLWQAAKLATVGELAASIAHELNNPLATISLRLESVLASDELPPSARKALQIVEQEADRMGHLVGNLLQFSRLGPDQESSVDLRHEVEKSLELVSHWFRKNRIKVEIRVAENLPTIYADRQKLRQVFLNLLTNAGDAMPAGGTLILEADPITLADGTPGVAMKIEDDGVGIAPENLSKVMDPFFTTKGEGKGTGLGLAICRRIIVQDHSGKLTIESTLGKGTIIRILLPMKKPSSGMSKLKESF